MLTTNENLEAQLLELEMLQSMFPHPGEIKFDEIALETIKLNLNSADSIKHQVFDITLKLECNGHEIELNVAYSYDYPQTEPDIFIRCSDLNKHQHMQLNKDCTDYVQILVRGEPCIYSIISWLQDNIDNYIQLNENIDLKVQKSTDKLSRLWIYSHHIYSKTKRREILNLAAEFNLSGFCMPGKPGVICIEGSQRNCQSWWQLIKSMTWKKIGCKVTEECADDGDEDTFRKFDGFKELDLQCNGTHMDLGELQKFLDQRGVAYVFKELFGLENR